MACRNPRPETDEFTLVQKPRQGSWALLLPITEGTFHENLHEIYGSRTSRP